MFTAALAITTELFGSVQVCLHCSTRGVGGTAPFHPLWTANCSGALVIVYSRDQCLIQCLKLFLFVETLCTLNCWALPLNVTIQYQYLQENTVYATELHWCNLFYSFFLMTQVFFFVLFLCYWIFPLLSDKHPQACLLMTMDWANWCSCPVFTCYSAGRPTNVYDCWWRK